MARKKPIADRIIELETLKRQEKVLKEQIATAQESILADMERTEAKTVVVEMEGRLLRATRVQPIPRTTVDEVSLKRVLGEKLWIKVSTRKLDSKKLETQMLAGVVDPMQIAECSVEKPVAPSLRITG